MNLDSIKNAKAESAKFMVDEITHVIKTFEKRAPGSKGEKQAVDYMESQLKQYCDEVKVEPFDVHPAAFMGWIYITISLMLLAAALYFFMPIVSLVLIFAGATFMICEFVLYRRMIDKLFKKKTSYNITAIKKCKGEVKSRIFYNGHPDAACEWTFNYHLGGAGFIAHFLLAIVGVVYFVGVVIAALIINGGVGFNAQVDPSGIVAKLGYGILAFVPFWVGMYFLWNEKRIVDGANDNLSGCYMGIAIMKALKEQGVELENTEVGVLITGSEEAGLRGAKAWCEAHKGEYQDVDTVIYAYDTIHDGKFLGVNVKDLNNIVPADPQASKLFKDAADKLGIKCDLISVPLGATDSAAFNQGGFKAAGITGMDHNLQDYYHTRRDTYDNLDEKGLADCFAVSVQVLEDLENGVR